MATQELEPKVSSFRPSLEHDAVTKSLGLLSEFPGSWEGTGFNLIARPNFAGKTNLFLQISETRERLTVDAIGSAIPNRGFGQGDINLFGVGYLQKISDAQTGGGLHFEPGLWAVQPGPPVQPDVTYPAEPIPAGAEIVFRAGTIPHGNALLAQGIAEPFTGPPTVKTPTENISFSRFPGFNSTPFATTPNLPPPLVAPTLQPDGSSEKATAAASGVPPFNEYDLTVPEGPANPRSPYSEPGNTKLPDPFHGIPLQSVIDDPVRLLQAHIEAQEKAGHTFSGTVINIATQKTVQFFENPNSPPGGTINVVTLPGGAGGIENTLFLEGGEPTGAQGNNALTALIYATFWITKVEHKDQPSFMQLQYIQMVLLNFPIFSVLNPTPPTPPKVFNIGWPHISVGTLRKAFD